MWNSPAMSSQGNSEFHSSLDSNTLATMRAGEEMEKPDKVSEELLCSLALQHHCSFHVASAKIQLLRLN